MHVSFCSNICISEINEKIISTLMPALAERTACSDINLMFLFQCYHYVLDIQPTGRNLKS
jgi:hypothetical protein